MAIKKFKKWLINGCVFGGTVGMRLLRAIVQKIKLIQLYQRYQVIGFLADPESQPGDRPRVLIAIAHITSIAEAASCETGAQKIERLTQTIEGLLTSLAHCHLHIVVCTVPGRHITHYLPDYQQRSLSVHEVTHCDPMYIGFAAQDLLAENVDRYDWLMFIEDDIVLYDSCFLEKIQQFNQVYGHDHALLFPNRYEMHQGKKSYIDLTIDRDLAWERLSKFAIGSVKFAECTNPHAGIYCLSQMQMRRWIASGRTWKHRPVMVGPLESAATFCLLECFSIFKPHPTNLNYLEVRHYDTKYSRLYPGPSPYILSAVSETP
ncbi:hypothetical protein OsccyDRAFT_2132 [Leptolyngbyaceae cyanobacterium JSC-12]|nr:hypothetical protein OsccyDRAFT_2132 [Leptolyngbyaceae cyanobacterium JSC-12]